MIDEQELNNKLAEWAGIKVGARVEIPGDHLHDPFTHPGAQYKQIEAPNFTESLDACFKWLTPLWIGKIMREQECSSDFAYAILFKKWLQELELNIPHAALSFCIAIEKLIDGKKGVIKVNKKD